MPFEYPTFEELANTTHRRVTRMISDPDSSDLLMYRGKNPVADFIAQELNDTVQGLDTATKEAYAAYYNLASGVFRQAKKASAEQSPDPATMSEIARGVSALRQALSKMLSSAAHYAQRAMRVVDDDGIAAQDELLLQSYRSISARMRSDVLSKGIYFSKEAPIITKVVFNRDKLARTGVGFDILFSHTVLRGMTVLGISTHHAEEAVRRDIRLSNPKAGPRPVVSDADLNEMFNDILELWLERNSSHGYTVYGRTLSWAGARWYWVVNRGQLSALTSARMGISRPQKSLDRRLNMKELMGDRGPGQDGYPWGFAFEREAVETYGSGEQ